MTCGRSGGKAFRERAFMVAAVLLLLVLPGAARVASGNGKLFLVHVTSPLTKRTDRTALVLRIVINAMQRGHQAAILFDDDGIGAVRIGHWYGGHTTPLDKARLTDGERTELAGRLSLPADAIPDNYGDLLRLLKGKGVGLFASKDVLHRRGIGPEEYDHAVTLLSLEEIVELFERAAITVTY